MAVTSVLAHAGASASARGCRAKVAWCDRLKRLACGADCLRVTAWDTEAKFPLPTLYQGASFMRVSRVLFGVLAGLLVAPGIAAGVGSVSGWVVAVGVLVGIGIAWEMRSRRMGIRFERDRVVAIYAIGSSSFRVDEIAGFSLRLRGPSGGTHTVYIDLVRGSRKPVPSVSTADWGPFKSQAISWAGGSTCDVIGRLTGHLERVRGAPLADARAAGAWR